MRRIWLANIRKYAIVDDEDYGRVSHFNWFGDVHGNHIYVSAALAGKDGEPTSLHRMVLGFPTGNIFFKDGNGLNCRKDNLSFFMCDIKGKMTDDLQAAVLGMLLGDASACMYECGGIRRFRLRMGHCVKQKGYLLHKAKLLSAYISRAGPKKDASGPYVTWYFQTRMSSDFEFLEMCYNRENKKFVSQKWVKSLTLISLAYWYMDDGFLEQNRHCNFCTHSFSIPECNRLVKKLKEMGFTSRIKFHRTNKRGLEKEYPIVQMDYWSSKRFVKQIDHLVVPCLRYKLQIIEAFKEARCSFCGDKIRYVSSNGESSSCSKKECHRAYCRDRYAKNRESVMRRQREYRAENRDRVNEWQRRRRAEKRA